MAYKDPQRNREWERTRRKPRDGRTRSLWSNYRLRRPDYELMLPGGCGICGRKLGDIGVDVDHDHACDHPGKGWFSCRDCVRGLLCHPCNIRLGMHEAGTLINADPRIPEYLGRITGMPYMTDSLF
jgi:Recombination endonuclease VII